MLATQSIDIYDAITETKITTNVTGNAQITIPKDEVRYLLYVPAGSTLTPKNNKLYIGNAIIDYNYGYNFTKLCV